MRRLSFALLALSAVASAQQNPFKPPQAKVQVAPVSGYDLKHVKVTLDVNYPARSFTGSVVNTLTPLKDGMKEIPIDAAQSLGIDTVMVDGTACEYRRDGETLFIAAKSIVKGKSMDVRLDYHSAKPVGGGLMGGGGWHWIQPDGYDPRHVGFWTQGETETNREWVPTWDYPNDFTTTEEIVTVDKDWSIIGNGALISNTENGNRRTFHWKQDLPHATYLMSLVGGRIDIKKSTWEGVELWYIAPGGKGKLIDASYGDTPDMLSFYSKITGVKYPWAKYAQNAMIDFGGGMENVSATTLGADSLTDGRDGYRSMSSLNSHELGHQWFGDFVTCKDWGHIWLNESFATIMQWMYFEHAQGTYAYQREITDGVNEYIGETRRYKRPLDTNLYPNPDSMFDSHTYPKGGAIMHTLRRQLGDKNFYGGLHKYLTEHAHTPVDAQDLCRAMTAVSGVNCQPFWDQWIYKPGHPVLGYDWTWANGTLTLKVHQTQDTSDGTPIYTIPAKFATIANGKVARHEIKLDAKENTFTVKTAKPDAVLLDPDLDFLRQMVHTFQQSELPAIFQYAPSAIDRSRAYADLLDQTKPDYAFLEKVLDADNGRFPAFVSLRSLTGHAKEVGMDFWKRQLNHPNAARRADAARAVVTMERTPEVRQILRSLVSDDQPTTVVAVALRGLDGKNDRDVMLKAAKMDSRRETIRQAAFDKLAEAGDADGIAMIFEAAASDDADLVGVAIDAMHHLAPSDQTRRALTRVLSLLDVSNTFVALDVLKEKPDPEMKPILTKMADDASLSKNMRDTIKKLLG